MGNPFRSLLLALTLLVATAVTLSRPPVTRGQDTAPQSEFIYALEDNPSGSNRIFGYRVDGANGNLTLLPGFPVATGFAGDGDEKLFPVQRLAYHAGTRRLFVLNDGDNNTVSVYRVNPNTGALAALPYTINLGPGAWLCLAVHPSGSPLLAGGFQAGAGQVASYLIGDQAAVAAPGSPFSTGPAGDALPYTCNLSQGGEYFYTGGWGPERFAGFRVNQTSGALSPLAGSPYLAGVAYPSAIASDSDGRLYLAEASGAGPQRLLAFTTAAGVPQAVSSAPFASGLGQSTAGLWHPAGFYIVGDYADTAIGVYRIDGAGASTALSAVTGSPFQTIGRIVSLALSRSGGLLFAANLDAQDRLYTIAAYAFNRASGALELIQEPPIPRWGGFLSGMVIASPPPASHHGYVYALSDSGVGNQIYGFAVDPVAGVLTPLPGFPINTGGKGGDIPDYITSGITDRLRIDRLNQRLYVLNNGSKTLSAYQINLDTGGLTPLPFSPLSLGEGDFHCLAVHPSGSPLIVSGTMNDQLRGLVASYVISSASATQAPGSPHVFGGSLAVYCGISPDGGSFYATLPDIMAYRIEPQTGSLTPVPGGPFLSGALSAVGPVVDTSGRLLLADGGSLGPPDPNLIKHSETVHAYNPIEGRPETVRAAGFPSGIRAAIDGLWHPAGFYLANSPAYTATKILDEKNLLAEGAIGVYRVAGSGKATTMTPVPGSPFFAGSYRYKSGGVGGLGIHAMTFDSSGRLIFATNSAGQTISTYSFDPMTGVVRGLSQLPFESLGASSWPTGIDFIPLISNPAPEKLMVYLPAVQR